ncbi:MAG: ABC transporter substrate-binding protein [Clostridia bacterium]|nr:ABC transporter substrate-binding protein [Clostridia bacterium]
MKNTKKILALLMAVIMLFAVTACSDDTASVSSTSSTASEPTKTAVTVKFASLKGPTGIGAVNIVNGSSDSDSVIYESQLFADPTAVVAECIKGNMDIAAVPTNAAATIYKKTNGKYVALCLNTLGTLYVMENGNTVTDIKSLNGKKVYSTGQGAVPQYVFEYILAKNGVNCKIEYLAEHAELTSQMIAGKVKIGVLPQPFVTQTSLKNTDVRIALDLTEEWDKIAAAEKNDSMLTMGCFVVKKEFADKNPEAVKQFIADFGESVKKVTSDPVAAGDAVQQAGIMDSAAMVAKAIPNCNITCIAGDEMKTILSGFLKVLYEQEPTSVGGSLPDDAFYYAQK